MTQSLSATSLTLFEQRALQGLRFALVGIFLLFGLQKFTAAEATGIEPLVSHSPFTSWLMILGIRGASAVFGVAELTFGVLLAYGLVRPGSLAAALGAFGSCITFVITLTFLFTTPGVFIKGSEPVMSSDGLFLLKDIVLLAVSVLLLARSLAARARS